MHLSRLLTGGTAALAALTVGTGLAGCSSGGPSGITVATVGRADVAEVVQAPATVAARASAVVVAPAAGSVGVLRVREGQQVRAGQVLLQVDSPDARRQLRQALQADRRAAQAGRTAGASGSGGNSGTNRASAASGSGPTQVQVAQADRAARRAFAQARTAALALPAGAARTQALAALRVSQSQYAAARASAVQLNGQVAAGLGNQSAAVAALSSAQRVQTTAAVESARRTVDSLTVRAPVDGTVSLAPPPAGSGAATASGSTASLLSALPQSLQSQAGALLGGSGGAPSASVDAALAVGRPVASGQPLLTVTDTSTLSLTAAVDETDVLLVQPGVTATAEVDAVPDASYAAAVTSLDPTPTASSRGGVAYVVRLSLGAGTLAGGDGAPTPRPGMSAVVALNVRTARNAVALPAAAVFRAGRGDAVWLVIGGVARQRAVRLGAQGATRVQVVQGLRAGQRVVVRGADQVREGQHVT